MVDPNPPTTSPTARVLAACVLALLASIAAIGLSLSMLFGQIKAVPTPMTNAYALLSSGSLRVPFDADSAESLAAEVHEMLRVIELLMPSYVGRFGRAVGIVGLLLGLCGWVALALGLGSTRGARPLARPLVATLSLLTMAIALRYAWLGEDWLVPDWQERFDRAVADGLLTLKAGIGSDEIRQRLLEGVRFRGLCLTGAAIAGVLMIAALFCPRDDTWGRRGESPDADASPSGDR